MIRQSTLFLRNNKSAIVTLASSPDQGLPPGCHRCAGLKLKSAWTILTIMPIIKKVDDEIEIVMMAASTPLLNRRLLEYEPSYQMIESKPAEGYSVA